MARPRVVHPDFASERRLDNLQPMFINLCPTHGFLFFLRRRAVFKRFRRVFFSLSKCWLCAFRLPLSLLAVFCRRFLCLLLVPADHSSGYRCRNSPRQKYGMTSNSRPCCCSMPTDFKSIIGSLGSPRLDFEWHDAYERLFGRKKKSKMLAPYIAQQPCL